MPRSLRKTARVAVRELVPGAGRLHRAYVKWAYSHRSASRQKLFTSIARENRWGDPDTISGKGSSLEQTAAIREALPGLWAELGIRSLADVPCGDFYWMSLIVDHLDYYFGGDIVPEVVERARERGHSQCEFATFDLLTDDFPDVDAILVRDTFVALSNRDVETALHNVCRSSARYLLTTTFPESPPQDVITGDWRALNLEAPPFSLPEPVRLIDERCTLAPNFANKRLGVWEVDEIRAALGVQAP